MSHSSRPGAATSLTVAHCTEPEFQVEEECWGEKWQGLPRMPKKLLGEQGHVESRLPCTSFSRSEFMGLHLIPNQRQDIPASNLLLSQLMLWLHTRSFVKGKRQVRVHSWCCLPNAANQTCKHCVKWEDQSDYPDCHTSQTGGCTWDPQDHSIWRYEKQISQNIYDDLFRKEKTKTPPPSRLLPIEAGMKPVRDKLVPSTLTQERSCLCT